jgi:hypothetical protein
MPQGVRRDVLGNAGSLSGLATGKINKEMFRG